MEIIWTLAVSEGEKQTNLRDPSLLLKVGVKMLVAALSSRVASKHIENKEERGESEWGRSAN